ncbi:hypothetical protein SAMN05216355_102167 [Actinomyces ruminicola]|uniref:Tat (Twin-arginine translocation) pathway signal sequence n=1 Tax=Actinomyces ruminicola TaxID=332524 RepID=A0A1H0AVN4_9ACTO|nr:hypothetical protein [Actinomyces ruminicola]SDN37530.1 hypothetical protein SAMN05216355_102167 [Actinomyces ruminicola]
MIPVSRRSLLTATAVTTAAGATSSCAALGTATEAAGAALSNPAVQSFLIQLAATIGAELALDWIRGDTEPLSDWEDSIDAKWGEWHESDDVGWCSPLRVYVDNDSRPSIVVKRFYADDAECKTSDRTRDPLNDHVGVFLDSGKDAVLLPAWAWQTVMMFAEQQRMGKEGADLKQVDQLLKLALQPTSSKTDSHETWANAVSTVSWGTVCGPVDVGRIENDDHTYRGIIKVAGFPDEFGESIVFENNLPTESA